MIINVEKEPKPTWVYGLHGNRASIGYWGSEKKARASLETLTDCWECEDCWGCNRCWACVRSVRCAQCSSVSNCEQCSWCWGCARIENGLWCGSSGQSEGMPKIPVIDDIHIAVYTAASAPNALNMATWHSCEARHCWGGWIIWLAGEPGKKLAAICGPMLAAMAISEASGHHITPIQFLSGDDDGALADMKRLAEKQHGENLALAVRNELLAKWGMPLPSECLGGQCVMSMQLNVLTTAMICSFIELYGNTDKMPEFIEAFLRRYTTDSGREGAVV